ncbi:acetolactate synthase 2 small subunit [Sulfidibacter corallicola]|uniref:Acetolactate synthase 2 small subunit n=1 Tax=Sulfidibacter corallicola TaxID=2818388 RepID=A0A8A4TTE3_SULCO|nr:acetolactate synthase 2 small subunit [Sulfidibacter corallicola]QTD52312.1 acetolactate synthase 2 small subunit [Sulfidibacter corallicola]
MRFFLQLSLRNMEGGLERVLGVVRFRGFRVVEMSAYSNPNGEDLAVTLKVESQRDGENLKKQLDKLFDVRQVEMFTTTPVPTPVHSGYGMPVAAVG